MSQRRQENIVPLYTHHGQRMKQGVLIKVNGACALGYLKDGEMLGYTTLDEINRKIYTEDLPEYYLET